MCLLFGQGGIIVASLCNWNLLACTGHLRPCHLLPHRPAQTGVSWRSVMQSLLTALKQSLARQLTRTQKLKVMCKNQRKKVETESRVQNDPSTKSTAVSSWHI